MTNTIQAQLKSATLLVLGLAALAMLQSPALADKSSPSKKYLLLDSRLIEKTKGVELRVGKVKKHPANPLFSQEKPWEPHFDNLYPSVIYDKQEKVYKCWYNPFIVDQRVTSTPHDKRNDESTTYRYVKPSFRAHGLCYATSKDGLKWNKPNLGLVEFQGNKNNNLLMRHNKLMPRGPHGTGITKDLRETDPARRYKMFMSTGTGHMGVSFSADGIHWCQPIPKDEIRARGDTRNNAFWAPRLGKYVGITRKIDRSYAPDTGWSPGIRVVARTESPDFDNWTKSEVVFAGLDKDLQLHDMIVFPYGQVYIGLVGLFNIVPEVCRQHVELAWSPDTVNWHRINPGTPLIANSQKKGAYDWGCIFPAVPIFSEDKILIYYGGANGKFLGWRKGHLCLATMKPDRFAGYETTKKDTSAEIITKAIDVSGSSLHISADVAKGGSIRVAVLDDQNRTIAACLPITKDVTDGHVKWKNDKPIKAKKIALTFELKNAKLYSFSFGQ